MALHYLHQQTTHDPVAMLLAQIGFICCTLASPLLAAFSITPSSQSAKPTPSSHPKWDYIRYECFVEPPLAISRPYTRLSLARYSDCVQALGTIQGTKKPMAHQVRTPDGYRSSHLWEWGTCSIAAGVYIGSTAWPDADLLYEATEAAMKVVEHCVVETDPAAPAGGGRHGLGGTISVTSPAYRGAGMSLVLRGRPWPRNQGPDPGWPRDPWAGRDVSDTPPGPGRNTSASTSSSS